MAKLISMPASPNFVSSNWSLVRTVGTTVSPFTGKTKTQEFDGVYWTAEVSLPPNSCVFVFPVKGLTVVSVS